MKVLALSGGTGTPKLLEGFEGVIGQENISVVVNTSDNIWLNGLYIAPDIDSITYLFSRLLDVERGWGIKGDTFNSFEALKTYGAQDWFYIGDRDLATHLYRTHLLNKGYSLTSVTKYIASKLGVKASVLPMCNEHVEARVLTDHGDLHIQEYLVKHKLKPKVYGITFSGIDKAKAPQEVLKAIDESELVVIGPSNPINSIGSILMVPGIREKVVEKRRKGTPIIAVSPIIGGRPLKGPAHIFLSALGYEASSFGVAEVYADVVTAIIVDRVDEMEASRIRSKLGLTTYIEDIVMKDLEGKVKLAKRILDIAKELGGH
ncbi:MAG: 2-phospho-L-lactate transferase [Sulfolobales archaeon]|nr:2-phospho-L-lactate transferase [Sulfolobales archaeon]MCX8198455.1 2-phospho-L-lactate transferase [Sulfolobales archaeon]MDW8169529.1 2-phospho-L-lactate transferase [Desulfurococcaceae archaeon]